MKTKLDITYDIHDLIRRRWSPRSFAPAPLDEATILTLLEAARWAASAMNEQPWRFIYAVQADAGRYARLFDCINPHNQEWARSAPALILTLVQTHFSHNNQPNRFALYDLGLAVGNLTTQATALGLYMHTMGGFSADKARETYNLPATIEPATLIAVGRLGDPAQLSERFRERELAPQQRKPLADLILR